MDKQVDIRKEAGNLFDKRAKLDIAISIIFWEDILKDSIKLIKKIQSSGLDSCEGNELIVQLKDSETKGIGKES